MKLGNVLAACAATVWFTASAETPSIINLQGRVAPGGGSFDGPATFKFAIVDPDATKSYWSNNGTSIAGSEPTQGVNLNVVQGLYTVTLGDPKLPNMVPIPRDIFDRSDLLLRIWFNDGTNSWQMLRPDHPIPTVLRDVVVSRARDQVKDADTTRKTAALASRMPEWSFQLLRNRVAASASTRTQTLEHIAESSSSRAPPSLSSPIGLAGDATSELLKHNLTPGTSPSPSLPSSIRNNTTNTVIRIPHIEFDTSLPIKPNTEFKVRVHVDRNTRQNGRQFSEDEPVNADTDESQMIVYLVASQQLTLRSSPYQILTIKGSEFVSDKAVFDVATEPRSKQDGQPGILTGFIFHEGYPCARVRRRIPIDTAGERGAPSFVANQAAVIEPPEVDAPPFPLVSNGPDLTISVVETESEHSTHARYQCFVQARHAQDPQSVVEYWDKLPREPEKYLHSQFAKYSIETSAAQARADLTEHGRQLFKRAPEVFKRYIWELGEKNQLPQTILLHTEESHIPWELMVVTKRNGGKLHDKPIGVVSAVGRWTLNREEPLKYPLRHFQFSRCVVWAPEYDDDPLPSAKLEEEFVAALLPSECVTPATYDKLQESLSDPKNRDATMLHMVCHGSSDEDQEGQQTIKAAPGTSPADYISVEALTGEPRFEIFCSNRPLIFLNSCEVGAVIQTFSGLGGFAPAFIQKEAGAVVAPLWSVIDRHAEKVAEQFYNTLKTDPEKSLAQVVQAIRLRAYELSNEKGVATYAAYCFYGDPLARCTFKSHLQTQH